MRKFFRFVDDERVVKGRDWWPVPGGVQQSMERLAVMGNAYAGSDMFRETFVYSKNGRASDHAHVIELAMRQQGHDPAHVLAEGGLVKVQVRG
eukprot:11793558-Alexandrium_andersonii.AAC.1